MSIEIKQSLKNEQSLTLTPQLKRSLEILQAPTLELAKIIEQELRTNPMLEEVDPSEYASAQSIGDDGYDDNSDLEDGALQADIRCDENAQKSKDFLLNSIPDKISLQEHLLETAAMDAENAKVAGAFASLAGSLDERGFILPDAIERTIAEGFDKDTVDAALKLLRNCDPPGIGADDMRDSLMIQLKRKGMEDSLAYKILENHFGLLMKRKVADIAEKEAKDVSDVESAILEISKLSTSPASKFDEEHARYAVPDIIYRKDENGDYTVELSREYTPRLKINSDYRRMVLEGKLRSSDESYVREKIRDGKNFMDALEQRKKTLMRIAQSILERQRRFFNDGLSSLKPMTMQDLSEELGLHATTIGRAIAEKYAETPFGILPLKFFFAGGYKSGDGESVACSSVKNRIKKIISAEFPKSPLSDAKIASILAEENIAVARRTVAKYREELGIAPKNLRRRY